MLPLVHLSLTLLTAPPAAGPCDLLDRAAATALIGQPVAPGTPTGPEPDEDTGGTMTYCTYLAGTAAVIVSQVTFASAAAASKATTKELVAGRMDGDQLALTEEPGLGDKAFWSYTAKGAQFVVLKGAVVIAVGVGGRLPKPLETYKTALRAAATAAASRL